MLDAIRADPEYESIYKGLHVYLTVSKEFLSIFVEGTTLLQKIYNAAMVVFTVRLWSESLMRLQKHCDVSLERNGMTAQTRRNLEICVGGVINMLSWCSDNGITELDPSLFGSDCVENFW